MTTGRMTFPLAVGLLAAALVGPSPQRVAAGRPSPTALQLTTVVREPGASDGQLVAARDDLYVTNEAAWHLRRYMLNGLPVAEEFTQVMRWKEGADGLIMGRPVALSLLGDRLLILDSLGSLWSYAGSAFQRALVPFRLQQDQGRMVAIAPLGSRLVGLDDRGQLWSYALSHGGYMSVPRPLLGPTSPIGRDGRRLVSLGPSTLGVLTGRGTVLIVRLSAYAPRATVRALPLPSGADALCAAPGGVLVAFGRRLERMTLSGVVTWRGDAESGRSPIRDLALDPLGRLYLLLPDAVLRAAILIKGGGR